MDREKLAQFTEYCQKLHSFGQLCAERVTLLEKYAAEADVQIKQQEEQVYICKEDLTAEKKKRQVFLPILAGALGFVLGFFVVK